MQRAPSRPRAIVLLGAGHTHLHVLRHWQDQPRPGITLTCVSDFPVATYSGMLTGALAGDYPPAAMEVPLAPLCDSAGARLVVGQVTHADLSARELRMSGAPPVHFDLLSVGVGSEPSTGDIAFDAGAHVIAIKPMQTFLARLRHALTQAPTGKGALRVAVVGGGAAGVEIALCLPSFVQATTGREAEYTLVSEGQILPDGGAGLVRRASAALDRAGVSRLAGRVVSVTDQHVHVGDRTVVEADLVILATGASPRPVLDVIDLPKDGDGFLATTDTLQSIGDSRVFAVGDAGSLQGQRAAKAGVYAVRQGPVLLENLRRSLEGRPLQSFTPQRSFLKLLNAGGGQAIGEWHGLAFGGRWCRWLKDTIDTRFVAQFQR
ncbi:MAG: FAD-dependent oxidoreductase [Acidobacteria bacterium]|nr:FAD-dependent oxidoreductase [Acidobacteriota bacterium]